MKHHHPLTTLASALALTTLCAQPATANGTLEEVVITSSRIEMPLRQVGTSISVISQDEIRSLGFVSLTDILRNQPSVAVTNTGGTGKASTLRIRGEEGYRTLVLMDGINISDTSGPQIAPRLEQILSSGIERVEILRGPQGLMYGADAGGVVNISTTAPKQGLAGDVSAEGGRYGNRQLAANLGMGGDTFDGNLSVVDLETDGFNARTTDTILHDDDGYENTSVHGRLGWNLSDDLRLSLIARDVDGENQYDDCYTSDTFAPTDACHDEYEQQSLRAVANYSSERFSHELSYSENDTDRGFYSEGIESYRFEGESDKLSYLGSFSGGDALRLVYGVDLQTESMVNGGFDTERDQDGYYLEYQGELSQQLFFTAGARYDDNEDFGSHTSWRVSGAYLLPMTGGEMKLRGAYGTGFRAPSLYEIAYNDGPWAYAPASGTTLDAEESEGYDLAVSWHGISGLYLEAVYFDQSVSDEIYFDLASFSGYLQGSGDSDSSGVELIAEWPVLESLSLSANYTYNDTDASDGSARVYRPEHLASLGISWLTFDGRLSLGLNARLSRDAVDEKGDALDDYEVLDLNASFNVLPGFAIYGRVENLLDEDYEEIPTYNTSGAAAYAGLRYSF